MYVVFPGSTAQINGIRRARKESEKKDGEQDSNRCEGRSSALRRGDKDV